MDRHSKGSPGHIEDLFKRVGQQIDISKKLIAVSKNTIAQSKEQYQLHATETEVYLDMLKINK